MEKEVIYELVNISKLYPGTIALSGINMNIYKGEILGIIGKNGAGKTTLVNIMYGYTDFSTGEIRILNKKYKNLNPIIAQKLGISLIPQVNEIPGDITILDYLFLGNYDFNRFGIIKQKNQLNKCLELFKRLDINLNPKILIGKVSLENIRLIELCKALWLSNSKVIILDETTASLSINFKKKVFNLLKKAAREEGVSIIFISHRLEEIMEICDRVSVLRDGKLVSNLITAGTTARELGGLIIGKKEKGINNFIVKEQTVRQFDEQIFLCKNLKYKEIFKNINLEIKKGQIIGLAGMVGSGCSGLLRYIGGLYGPTGEGEIILKNKLIKPISPKFLLKSGIGYLTLDREKEGIFHKQTIKDNIIIGNGKYVNKIGILENKKIKKDIIKNKDNLDIKMGSIQNVIDSLSGGNKQKILFSRFLNHNLSIYLLDELTEGIDIGTRIKILDFIKNNLSINAGVIFSSNVVSDLIDVCDLIYVMFKGKMVDKFERKNFNEHNIYMSLQGFKENKNLILQ